MSKSTMNNVTQMFPQEVLDMLVTYYSGYLKDNGSFANADPYMFWGQPGVGKSYVAKTTANKLASMFNKKLNYIDYRLAMRSLVEVGGIPFINKEEKVTEWARPREFMVDPDPNVLNFFNMEELPTAPISVQSVALQILLDRSVGELKFPDNCVFLATGNRTEDRGSFNRMGFALCDRLGHLEFVPNFESWKVWAYQKGIDSRVISFLNFQEKEFNNYDPASDTVAFSTPRSWEKVSNKLKAFDAAANTKQKDSSMLQKLVATTVGEGTAHSFIEYCRCYQDLPSIDRIMNGERVDIPSQRPDVVWAICSSIPYRLIKSYESEDEGLFDSRVGNVIDLSLRFKKEYPEAAAVLMKDISKTHEEMFMMIMENDRFEEWEEVYGSVLRMSA